MADESRIEKRKKEKKSGDGDEGSGLGSYVAVVVVVGIIGVVSYFLFFSGGAAAEVEPWNDVKAIEGEDPTMVAADADENGTDEMVEVVYYGDFGCAACVQFETTTFSTLKDEYIATGDVKFVFRPLDFQAQGDPDSRTASLAAPAVWEQNRSAYWTWHRTMFSSYEPRGNWATPEDIARMANEAGADGDAIAQSVRQNEYAPDIQEHRTLADRSGVQGTPSFAVNDTLVTGGSYEQLSSEIESELGE